MNPVELAHIKGYRVDANGVVSSKRQILKPRAGKSGYEYFKIRTSNPRSMKNIMVHRLQAFQKFGRELFKDGVSVRHLDGNQRNNSAANIAIGTHSQNMMDKPESVRVRCAVHASSFSSKHSHAEIIAFYKVNGWEKTKKRFAITSTGSLSFILNESAAAKALIASQFQPQEAAA